MGNLLWTIIVGLVVGALAKLIMPGKDPGGIIVTILLGIAGSFIGHFVGQQIVPDFTAGQIGGFVMSILGALLLLFIYRLITGRKTSS